MSVPPNQPLTLTPEEWEFFAAAADTMIPADELTPAGSECGIVTFIDRQLAGPWGQGAKMYREGPHRDGKAEHGYQLAHTPRDYFAAGVAAVNEWTRGTRGCDFHHFDTQARNEALTALENGTAALDGIKPKPFFEALLQLVMEGLFADPIYGGNRDKVGWRLVGYPGLPAHYADLIEPYRNKRYHAEPRSIGDFPPR